MPTDDLGPEAPNTIRNIAQLEQALLDGLNSGPATPMTKADWEDIRREAHERATARRNGQPFNNA